MPRIEEIDFENMYDYMCKMQGYTKGGHVSRSKISVYLWEKHKHGVSSDDLNFLMQIQDTFHSLFGGLSSD